MSNSSAPARPAEVLDTGLGARVKLATLAPLTAWDLCDSSAVGSEVASVRFTKSIFGQKILVLDLCGHHTRHHGADLLADGWTNTTGGSNV